MPASDDWISSALNWKRVGPILEQERRDRVMAMTDADAARDALRLFDLRRPFEDAWRRVPAR